MSGICKAGNRQGLKCQYKKNVGEGLVLCTCEVPCSERISKQEHENKLKAKLAEVV